MAQSALRSLAQHHAIVPWGKQAQDLQWLHSSFLAHLVSTLPTRTHTHTHPHTHKHTNAYTHKHKLILTHAPLHTLSIARYTKVHDRVLQMGALGQGNTLVPPQHTTVYVKMFSLTTA